MEVDAEVWLKGKESKKNANDATWSAARVISKDVDANGVVTITVRNAAGHDYMFSSNKGGLDLEDIQLKNLGNSSLVENLIELPYLNEPEILQSLSSRYHQRKIYTYTGNILIAINPLQNVVPDANCEGFLQKFASDVKTSAVGVSDGVPQPSNGDGNTVKRHSIIISGESGSGKTECAKLLSMFLISADVKSSEDFLGIKSIKAGNASDDEDDDESTDDDFSDAGERVGGMSHTMSMDSMMGTPMNSSKNSFSPKKSSDVSPRVKFGMSEESRSTSFGVPQHRAKSGFYRAYQLSTMEHLCQVTPILEAFGNACIAHTHNSSRLGKYVELAFTKYGELVGGEVRTYLLENVRVTRQLDRERNFHIFYQLTAGASAAERTALALNTAASYHYTNQGGKEAMSNPLVNDTQNFIALKEQFFSLGFNSDTVDSILQVVAGVLHLGQIDFSFTTALEGQVANIVEKFTGDGYKETEVAAAARLCSLNPEDLVKCLTVRSVLLNKELFHKSLTPAQALSARDAVSKAVYKKLFNWLVQELNAKLKPTQTLPAEVASCVGILDIFGFDSFAVNSFEQLCINYANEALQQHFSQHMFKLELIEYKREGIPFEDIEFPDNQESLDCITNGVFTILDDQCRIPNATDKRLASQLYKELTTNSKFSASSAQVSAGYFCVQHFAGPVVYSTDKFVEKNLDELPQDAAVLLKASLNVVLADREALSVASISLDGSESAGGDLPAPPVAPVMAAYVSRTKAEPAPLAGSKGPTTPTRAAQSTVNVARRGSLAGKGVPYSVVAQLRNEVSVMMTHINATIPHYVCCINPVARVSNAEKTAATASSQFQTNIVAAQLRYGGILEAVKIARSGLPNRFQFLEFFQRYRSLVNPNNPMSKSVVPHLSAKDDETVIRSQCELLIESLTNTTAFPVVVSALQARLVDEMQVILCKRSVRKWMGSIGGVVNAGGAKVGLTKVFLGKQAHVMLESCLFHQLALCRSKIGGMILCRLRRREHLRTIKVIYMLQRIMRGTIARLRVRMLRRRKGDRNSATLSHSSDQSTLAREVKELKHQDLLIQEQIKKLVSSNKVTEEPEFLTIDFAATKSELQSLVGKFISTSIISVKTAEACELIGDGYTLLRAEKLIPLTAASKVLSFGRNVKTENRTSSVKAANKIITKDHPVFKTIHKMMDRLRELFELAKLEKEVLDSRKKSKFRLSGIPASPGVVAATPSAATAAATAASNDAELVEIEGKMASLDRIAKLARSIYQFYHQYIIQMVKEYGFESRYKTGFSDENQYLLAFVALVEARQPLLSFEKSKDSTEAGVGLEPTGSTKNFPLYIPTENQQGPQHMGYLPLCTYGGVHFKVLPTSHTPGVEFAVNSMHRLLKGYHTMYPIRYLKIIGKSGEGKGKESFYQAATEFGSQSLSSAADKSVDRASITDFTAIFITSVLFGAKALHPENLMVEPADEKGSDVRLKGINCDDRFLNHMFKYKAADVTHSDELNVVFMMPQMDVPLCPKIVALLSEATTAPVLVTSWLKELFLQNRRFSALKSAGFTPADLTALMLPISLPPHAAAQIQHLLIKMCKVLQQAAGTGTVLTHSDLLAAMESVAAEKYAELRIRISGRANFSYFDMYTAVKVPPPTGFAADTHTKGTFTTHVEHLTAEVLNTLDFSTLPDSAEQEGAYSALFNQLSFLPSLHLRNITESQLSKLFARLLEQNRAAHARQMSLHPAGQAGSPNVHVTLRTAVRTVVICGLAQAAAKQIAASSAVHAIQHELAIKISFDVVVGKK